MKRPVGIVVGLVLALSSPVRGSDETLATLTARAFEAYQDHRYKDSARLYETAAKRFRPGDTGLHFNAACAYALAGRKKEAFRRLDAAIHFGFRKLEDLQSDPDLMALRSDPQWARLEERLNKLRATMDLKLRAELLAISHADQEARKAMLAAGEPGAAVSAEVERVDAEHRERLRQIIAEKGWPTVSLVGEDGAGAAWLVAQHADRDLAFQKECLELMQAAAKRGEASRELLAYLVDRVRVGAGEKQVYGTQFETVNGKLVPSPIEDEAHVDKRRRAVGLEPLADYRQQLDEVDKAPSEP